MTYHYVDELSQMSATCSRPTDYGVSMECLLRQETKYSSTSASVSDVKLAEKQIYQQKVQEKEKIYFLSTSYV